MGFFPLLGEGTVCCPDSAPRGAQVRELTVSSSRTIPPSLTLKEENLRQEKLRVASPNPKPSDRPGHPPSQLSGRKLKMFWVDLQAHKVPDNSWLRPHPKLCPRHSRRSTQPRSGYITPHEQTSSPSSQRASGPPLPP